MITWNDPPDIEEVHNTFLKIGQTKAKIRRLKIKIDVKSIDIKKDTPRKPHLVLEATQKMQEELAELEAELEELEMKRDYLNFHKDMWRQYGYNNK